MTDGTDQRPGDPVDPVRPALPPHLADLLLREERFSVLPNELSGIEAFVRGHARRNR